MSGCHGKCDSCGPTDCGSQAEPNIKYSTHPIEIDAKDLLAPFPKQKEDGSDLHDLCKHYPYGDINRYQCDECIREWVAAKQDEEIICAINELSKLRKKIAAERIQEELKDKKRKCNVT